MISLVLAIFIILSMPDIGLFQETGDYKITSISEKREVYIIHATRKNNHRIMHYLIVSDKDTDFEGERIKVGKTYYLELTCLLPIQSINGIDVVPNLGVVGISYGDMHITTNRRFHYSIYHADNLHGLCIDSP